MPRRAAPAPENPPPASPAARRQRPLRSLFVPLRALHVRIRRQPRRHARAETAPLPHTARSAARVLMPIAPACAEFKNSSRITFAAYGSAIASTSALSALAITSRQKRSMAPSRLPIALEPRAQRLCRIRRHRPHQHRETRASARALSATCECLRRKQSSATHEAAPADQRRPKQRAPSARLDHGHRARPVDSFRHSDALVEPDEIRAAAKEHMLAVVDDFIDARMHDRSSRARPGSRAAPRAARAVPASASAQAALMPATPPPTTITVLLMTASGSPTLSSAPHKFLFYDRPCRCIAACAAIVANSARAPSSKRRPNFKGTQRSEASQALVMGLMRASVWLE